MKKPFEVIKQGEATLDWGYHPAPKSWKFWVRATCKECGEQCSLAIGWDSKSSSSSSRSKTPSLDEATGYSIIRYRRRNGDASREKGWCFNGIHETFIRDLCSNCNDHFMKYVSRAEERRAGTHKFPHDIDLARQYFEQWQRAQITTLISRAIKPWKRDRMEAGE